MDPGRSDVFIADVVSTIAGRDAGQLFYVTGTEQEYLYLVNGKDRTLEKPKRKKRKHVQMVLRSETRVAQKLRAGDKVLNGELRRDLASISRDMQGNNLGG